MNSLEYIQEVLKTEPEKFSLDRYDRLLHAGIGIATESGEFLDALKRAGYSGKAVDVVNMREELGDMLWYIALAMKALDTDFETEMERNIAKLRTRHGEEFDINKNDDRNLEAEREILDR